MSDGEGEGIELGTAYVSVTISTRGIGSQVKEQIVGPAEAGGEEAGAALGGGIDKGSSKGIGAAKVALVGLGVAAAGAALKSVESFDKAGEEVKQLELLTGGSAKQMSELRYAAGLMGVDASRLGVAIKTFAKNAETPAIKNLGLDIYNADGSLKPFDQTILTVADHFKGMADGSAKTALAVQLFGRSGTSMLKLLDQGSAGISAMEKEADKLGVTLTQQNVDMVSKNVEGLKQFQGAMAGLEAEAARGLVPILIKAESAGTDFLGFVHAVPGPLVAGTVAVLGAGVAYTKLLKPMGDAGAAIVKDAQQLKAWITTRLAATDAAEQPLKPMVEETIGASPSSGVGAASEATAAAARDAGAADDEAAAAEARLQGLRESGTASADELATAETEAAAATERAATTAAAATASAAELADAQAAAASAAEAQGIAEDAALGPLAPLGIALTVGAGLLGVWGTANRGASKEAKDLTTSIKADSGALGENTEQVLKNQLASGEDLKQLAKAGVAWDTVTSAVFKTGQQYISYKQIQSAVADGSDIIGELQKEGGARNDLIAKIFLQNGITGQSSTLVRNLIENYQGADTGMKSWAASLSIGAAGAGQLNRDEGLLTDTTGKLAPAIDEANKALSDGVATGNQLHLVNRTRLTDMTDEISKSAALRSATESYQGAVADLAANQKEIAGTADDENQIRTQAAQTRVEDLNSEASAVQALGSDQRTYASDLRGVNDDEYQLAQSVKAVAAARANEAQLIRNETTLTAALTSARKDAQDQIVSSEDNAEGSALTVQQDKFTLATDEAADAAGPAAGSTDPNAQAELDLQVKQDKLQVKEATEASAKALDDENTAKKNGIDQAPGVVAASVAIVNNKAQEAAASQTTQDALRSEAAANQTLVDGRQQLVDQGVKIQQDYADISAAALKTRDDQVAAQWQVIELQATAQTQVGTLTDAVQSDWAAVATAGQAYGLNLSQIDSYLLAISRDGIGALPVVQELVALLGGDVGNIPGLQPASNASIYGVSGNAGAGGGGGMIHRATGGLLRKGQMSEVDELGPELWQSGGHEYLMPASDGNVVPTSYLSNPKVTTTPSRGTGGGRGMSVGEMAIHEDLSRIEALQRTANDHLVNGHETGAGIGAASTLAKLHGIYSDVKADKSLGPIFKALAAQGAIEQAQAAAAAHLVAAGREVGGSKPSTQDKTLKPAVNNYFASTVADPKAIAREIARSVR